jgi:hypothetical protein
MKMPIASNETGIEIDPKTISVVRLKRSLPWSGCAVV